MALPQEMIPYLFPDRWSREGGLWEQENLFTVRDDSYYFQDHASWQSEFFD